MTRNSAILVLLLVLSSFAGPVTAMEGDELWEQTYGGSGQDWGYDMKVTDDNGFILTGYTKSYGAGGSDVYLVKVDAAGEVQWSAPFGSAANDVGAAVIQTSDGGYLVAGNRNIGSNYTKDGLLIKVNAAGEEQWQQTYGGNGEDEFADVIEYTGGGYVMAGTTDSFGPGGHVAWILRVDESGAIQWQNAVALAGHGSDYLTGLVETPEGDFVTSGYSGDGNTFPTYNASASKFTSGGSLAWQRSFDDSDYDRAYDITRAPGSGFAMAGPSLGAMTIWRLDAGGFLSWTQRFNTVTGDVALAVSPTSDGGFLVGGDTYNYDDGGYQMYIGKTDGDGDALWERLYGGAGSEICRAIAETPFGDYAFAGVTNSSGAGSDDLLLIVAEGAGPTAADQEPAAGDLARTLGAHPNPFNPATTISFTLAVPADTRVIIADTQGRRVRTLLDSAPLPAGPQSLSWDGRDDEGRTLSSGLYFARVSSGGQKASEKLIMIK